MNGGIIGKANTSTRGLWTPNEVSLDVNNVAKKPIIFDPCEAVAGWYSSKSGLSCSLNTNIVRSGSGAMNLIKTSTSWVDAFYLYRYIDLNLLGKTFGVNVYVSAGKYANLVKLSICLMDAKAISSKTWEVYHDFTTGFVSGGWARLELPVADFTTGTGTPALSATRLLAIGFSVSANAVTIGAGDLVVDDFYYRR